MTRRRPQRLKILLSEAASTSARQTLYALGRLGHTIDVCDPQRLCLGRFSRYVRTWYRCPPFNTEPVGYVRFLLGRLRRGGYDVLFPVHDQVFLLSRFRQVLCRQAGLALPDFQSLKQVQSKVAFLQVLEKLKLPYPPTVLIGGPAELDRSWDYPCYVKLAYSTAGCGVWLVHSRSEMQALAEQLRSPGGQQRRWEILVQQPAQGTFHAVQTVFQHGALVAAHCYKGRAVGVGGSAHARESVAHPLVCRHVARLGAHLNWHGALHMECFLDPAGGNPVYIEANPRIGETLNATLSGTNLCQTLVDVSLDRRIPPIPPPQVGVRTHSVLMSLMAAAEHGQGRWALLAELWRACTRQGVYRHSQDELTRPSEDPWSLIPALAVTLQLLLSPATARRIVRRAVDNYSLSEAAVRRITNLNAEC